MKKLSYAVSIAALLAASPALAQNNSSIEQIDVNTSSATVNQTAAGGNTNDSMITQRESDVTDEGKNLEATVNQAQTSPTSPIGSTTGNDNKSFLLQAGKNASATVDQGGLNNGGASAGNHSEIVQRGIGGSNSTNEVHVIQRGARNSNTSLIGEVDDDNEFIKFGQNGEDLTARVEQTGNDTNNSSAIIQVGNGSSPNPTPVGDENINVYQGGNTNENTSTIDQNGAALTSNVDQDGMDLINDSDIVQKGESSSVVVTQLGEGGTNTSSVNQDGIDSSVDVMQDGVGTTNDSLVEQFGNDSTVDVTQNGDGNTNDSDVFQISANSSDATVNQGGNGTTNTSSITQSNGSSMTATVTQN